MLMVAGSGRCLVTQSEAVILYPPTTLVSIYFAVCFLPPSSSLTMIFPLLSFQVVLSLRFFSRHA